MSDWRTDEPPTDGTRVFMRTIQLLRFQPYKPASQQFKAGIKGRWQQMNEYGAWDNCPSPLGREWTLADSEAQP